VSGGFPTGDDHVDCTSAIHQLYVYLDGQLTDERRIQIAEHLEWCGPCAGAAVFEAELRVVIADRCKDHVPESLRRRVAELIEAEQSPSAGNPERNRS
jgi:mycothiol system anti-sigma-R factor